MLECVAANGSLRVLQCTLPSDAAQTVLFSKMKVPLEVVHCTAGQLCEVGLPTHEWLSEKDYEFSIWVMPKYGNIQWENKNGFLNKSVCI